METTRLSLLAAASAGSEEAWPRLVELYQPWIYGWLRRQEVTHHDAEELAQDVLRVLVEDLPEFRHSGRRGAFRTWLRQITVNRAKGFWRAGRLRPKPGGGSMERVIEQLADDSSDLSRRWEREHDQHVLRQLLSRIEASFQSTTVQAFRRQVFDGKSAEQVAAELNVTLVAAYCAKSRVLQRLRKEAAELVDESIFHNLGRAV